MICKLAAFVFDTVGGKLAALGIGALAVFVWWQVDRAGQRSVGRKEAIATVKVNNAEDRARADAAAAKSRSGGGMLNPNYRD